MYVQRHLHRGLLLVVATISVAFGAAGVVGAEDTLTPGGTETSLPTPEPSPPEEGTIPPEDGTTRPVEESPTTLFPADDGGGAEDPVPAPEEPSTTVAPETTVAAPPTDETPESPVVPTTSPPVSSTEAPTAPSKTVTQDSSLLSLVVAKAPTAPRYPKATAGIASVKLTWYRPSSNGGAAIDRYVVQRAMSSAGPWTSIGATAGTSLTSTGLKGGTRYYFRIAAHNTAGYGPFSTLVSAIPRTVPSAPRSLKATAGNKRVTLTWLAPLSNGGATIGTYRVEQWTGSNWKLVASPTGRSYTVTNLVNGKKYSFRVRAHNNVGWSPASTPVSAVPRTVPAAPRYPGASPGNTIVQLVWSTPAFNGGAKVDKYVVEKWTGTAWKPIAYPTGLGYTATNLVNGTTYSFRVRAHNIAGWSPPSTPVNAVPRTVPSAPPSPKATPLNTGEVLLTWQQPSNNGALIDQYEAQWATSTIGPWNTKDSIGSTGYKVGGLTPGTKYHLRVRAHNPAGWGPWSTLVTTVPRTVPGAVPACTAAQINQGSKLLTVDWETPLSDGGSPIESYNIYIENDDGMYVHSYDQPNDNKHHALVTVFDDTSEEYAVFVSARNAVGLGVPCMDLLLVEM